MNNKVMTKPSEVVRDFFQELVAGLPTDNAAALEQPELFRTDITALKSPRDQRTSSSSFSK
jgi:hypothetical protein